MLNVGDILEALPAHTYCHSRGRFWEFMGEVKGEEIDMLGGKPYKLKNLADGSIHNGFYMGMTLLNKTFFKVHKAELENK